MLYEAQVSGGLDAVRIRLSNMEKKVLHLLLHTHLGIYITVS